MKKSTKNAVWTFLVEPIAMTFDCSVVDVLTMSDPEDVLSPFPP